MREMISLDDLRLFVAVARELSFVGAARRLNVPTSSVSRRVAGLERSIGKRLLQRTSRKVGLTAEGTRLLARAEPLVSGLATVLESESDRDEEPAGRLRVTAPVMVGAQRIGPALFAFAARHPRVELDLVLTNAVLDLVEERVDLAFRAGPVRDRELVARRVWKIPFSLAASPHFVATSLGGRTRLDRATLDEAPAIVGRAGATWRLLRRDGSLDEVRPRAPVTVNDPRVAVTAAVHGLGIVCTSAEEIATHGKALVPLTVKGRTVEEREIFAVYPSRRLLAPRVRQALDWVIAHG